MSQFFRLVEILFNLKCRHETRNVACMTLGSHTARKPFKTPVILRFLFQGMYKQSDKPRKKKDLQQPKQTYGETPRLKTRLKHITNEELGGLKAWIKVEKITD